MKVITVINGKTYMGLAYWSDRTIPGQWVYPDDWIEGWLDWKHIDRENKPLRREHAQSHSS